MPRDYYFGNRPDQSKSIARKVMIGICIAVLAAAVGIFGWLHFYNKELTSVMSAFQDALDSHEYSRALEIYRDVQSDVLQRDPDDTTDSRERQVMESMENIVFARVDEIESQIRDDRYSPSADDQAFLEQMAELTGARMTLWLNSLCGEFLLGTIEKPTLQYIFDQIGGYTNVTAAAAPLEKEIDAIEIARGDVQTAEQYFSSGEYIKTVEKYEDIISHTTGFVNDYARNRMQECEQQMYDPIMKECDELLKTYKYYTAEEILSDMARIFPDDQKVQAKLLEATSNTTPLVEYSGNVEMLCVKPLIADTKQAFSDENASSADSYMLTSSEFRAILEQLYAKNYILIDVRSMTDQSNRSAVVAQQLSLPEGKKPVIIVVENLNYSAYQSGMGLCSRLVINDQNQVCGEYTDSYGQTVVNRGAEAIGILDAFVEEHPDFTFNGAKGVVSFTGYETVMGYITNEDQLDDRNSALSAKGLPAANLTQAEISRNCDDVKAILSVMKETGWVFASSTYGFINANSCSMDVIKNDTEKWLDQVGPLTGDVEILVYPNGDFIKGSDPRCVYLKEKGFRIFCGVGPNAYFTFGDNYLYLDRAMLNGDTLRNQDYSRLFDLSKVYDSSRPR